MEEQAKHHEPIVYELYREMKNHVGKENAVSAQALSRRFNISERELREHISTIRKSTELRAIIGSSNKGYYLCRAEEFERANARLERQAFSLLKVAYANKKKAAKDGQYLIPLGTYWKEVFEAFGCEETGEEEKLNNGISST